jgi:hypothetical protein
MRHIIRDEISFEMTYMNIRGLNHQSKQQVVRKLVGSNEWSQNRVLALVETRLHSDFHIKEFKSL